MFITGLRINNFMQHQETALTFSLPVALFLGANEQGKSTIAKAVRWALDEVYLHPVTHKPVPKKDQYVLIRQGVKRAEVVVTNSTGKEARRSRTPSGSDGSGWTPALPQDVLSCLCDSNHYHRMDPKDRAAMLFSLLKIDVSADALATILAERLGEKLLAIGKANINRIGEEYRIGGFPKAQAYAIESRRACKRALAELPQEPKKAVTITYYKDGKPASREVDLSALTVEGTEGKINEIQEFITNTARERGKLEGKSAESLANIRMMLKGQEREFDSLTIALARANEAIPPDARGLNDELQALTEKITDGRKKIAALEDQMPRILDKPKDTCPMYGCPCGSIDLIGGLVQEAAKKWEALKLEADRLRESDKGMRARLVELQRELAARDKSVSDRNKIEADLERVRREIERLEQAEKDASTHAPDHAKAAELGKEIDRLKAEKLAPYTTLLGYLRQYIKGKEHYDNALKPEAIQAQIDAWDELEKVLGNGPGSIKAELIGKTREKINSILAMFNRVLGRQMELTVELEVSYGDAMTDQVLSTSALRRSGIAMQAVIAELSGAKFFVTDDVENLTKTPRNNLVATCLDLAKAFGMQVWVIIAANDEEIERIGLTAGKAGVHAFRVAGGKVTSL